MQHGDMGFQPLQMLFEACIGVGGRLAGYHLSTNHGTNTVTFEDAPNKQCFGSFLSAPFAVKPLLRSQLVVATTS